LRNPRERDQTHRHSAAQRLHLDDLDTRLGRGQRGAFGFNFSLDFSNLLADCLRALFRGRSL
jgi:hypothetical protein